MKAILTGTIANLGKEYVITLTAQNTATGDEIVSEQAQAPDKEHVLDALGKAAAGMRAKLGEDLASISKLDTPFGQATTPSLDAFRAYALGEKARGKGLNICRGGSSLSSRCGAESRFSHGVRTTRIIYVNAGEMAKADKYLPRAFAFILTKLARGSGSISAGHYYENMTAVRPR